MFTSTFNLPACTTANSCFTKIYASGSQPVGDPGWGLEMSLDVQWAHAIAPLAKIILVEATNNTIDSLLHAVQVAVQHGANVVSMSWASGEFPTQTLYDTYFNVDNVSFTASSGDAGAGVLWPASSAYVIGTGGTSLTTTAQGNYISETAWSGSGGGISAFVPLPSYQANFANKNNPGNMRGIPDVSFVSDPDTGLSVYDSYGYGGWLVVGGTSAAAPSWAGIIAVTNSASSTKLPSLNSLLYQAATTSYSTAYHDIITGVNGPCGPVCTAQPGYDYITGLGTPQSSNLVKIITGSSYSSIVLTVAARNPLLNTQAFIYYSSLGNVPSPSYLIEGIPGASIVLDAGRSRFVISNIVTPRAIPNVMVASTDGLGIYLSNAITIPSII